MLLKFVHENHTEELRICYHYRGVCSRTVGSTAEYVVERSVLPRSM